MIYPPAFLVRAVLTMFTFYQQSKDHLSHYTTQPSQTSGCYCGNKQHFCSNELCIPLTGSDSSAANTLLTLTPLICQYIYTSPTDAQRATVVRLDWYKYTNGLEHEFILATLVRKDNLDRKYYLRFERRATHHANVCEKNMLKEENIESFSHEHQAQFRKDVLVEKDTVRRVRWQPGKVHWEREASPNILWGEITWRRVLSSNGVTRDDPGKVHLVASYDFASLKPLSFRDLVLLVDVVDNKSEAEQGEEDKVKRQQQQASIRQKPLMEQSYWFARTCIGVAKKRCALDELTKATSYQNTTGGTYWVGKSDYFWSRSEENRLSVNGDDAQRIEELGQVLDAKIQENDEYLQKKYMDGKGGRLLAEKRLAEAQQRTKEAQQRILELQQSLRELQEQHREQKEQLMQQKEEHHRGGEEA